MDAWRKAITNEGIAIRPNFGKKTYIMYFGNGLWVWECNHPPRLQAQGASDSEVEHNMERRVLVGHFKHTITPNQDLVDEEAGHFLIDTRLTHFLSDPRTACVYILKIFIPFT